MSKKKIKLLALIGASSSGKDSICKTICELVGDKAHRVINCTTRPPREGEVNGKDYIFITNEQFAEDLLNDKMIEATAFNDWFYGTHKDSLNLNKVNIGVFNPSSIDILQCWSFIDLTVIYICTSQKERLLRALNREDDPNVDEVVRRYLADEKDFSFLDFDYKKLDNNTTEDYHSILGKLTVLINELSKNLDKED